MLIYCHCLNSHKEVNPERSTCELLFFFKSLPEKVHVLLVMPILKAD